MGRNHARYRVAAIAATGWLIGLAGPVAADCAEDRLTVTGEFGSARFSVEVADTPQERNRGLMFVEQMGTFEGMLFVYETPRRATFWMKNTLIPLDMLFADSSGTITRIHAEAVPLDETVIDGGDGVRYVLEINGGLAERLGIGTGDVMQHPSFGDEAALPCPAS